MRTSTRCPGFKIRRRAMARCRSGGGRAISWMCDRLICQLQELHKKGISGVQVNYSHYDTPGWPTYPAEPPIFSEAWWKV